ncbi:MAG: DUF1802 family protein, partial [Cyanobacteriota bacterium]|nr:DUF1802 family protein [Cyanobacteriota bacterium]
MPIANLTTAMGLPAPDVEALIQGRAIAAIASRWLDPGEKFALYPAEITTLLLSDEELYRSKFLPIAKIVLDRLRSEGAIVKAWAKCELCQMLDETASLEAISELTIWTAEVFQKILSQRPYIFLAYLRIYQLSQSLEMPAGSQGNFIPLPHSISVTETSPILSDRVFSRRCHQLQNRLPPEHPELEDLEACVSQYATTHPAAKALARAIQVFLNWSNDSENSESNLQKDWVTKISEIGNSSEGNEFEKLVRKSFIELGFSNSKTDPNLKDGLNPEKTGGAGGLDLYCDTPYQVVGECKATKTEKVPDGTPAQLVKLGQKFLNTTPDRQSNAGPYEKCIKIILAAGELTQAANQTAIGNQMNVLRPETLQRLVKIKNRYPGSVDLLT